MQGVKAKYFVESPLVEGASASLIDTVGREHIISRYRDVYKIDVSDYFCGIESAKVYECQVTGYRFYYPFSLTGKENLYRQLEFTADGKYKDDKWEFRKALTLIEPSSRILDVGCGKGDFVRLAMQAGLIAHGLELNSASAAEARQKGLSASTEMIGEHAKTHKGSYDAVCSFQVLEHIPNVREFIQDCISVLRPGGTLIFAVPNNDGFVGLDCYAALNMPPHHMGLWTRKSLFALTYVFNLDLKSIEIEPLGEIDWYMAVMEQRYMPNKAVLSLYYRLGLAWLFRKWVQARANHIPGHSILAVYKKRN